MMENWLMIFTQLGYLYENRSHSGSIFPVQRLKLTNGLVDKTRVITINMALRVTDIVPDVITCSSDRRVGTGISLPFAPIAQVALSVSAYACLA
jgi:hypothetical protein